MCSIPKQLQDSYLVMLVLNDGYRSNIVIILHDSRATSLCLGPIHRWGRVLAWLATSDRFYCPPRKNNWMKRGCLAQTSFTFQYCILLTCHPHTFPLTIFWRGRNFSSAALHVNVILFYFFFTYSHVSMSKELGLHFMKLQAENNSPFTTGKLSAGNR